MSEPVPATSSVATGYTIPRALFVYLLLYGGMTVLAGFLAVKQAVLWPTSLGVERVTVTPGTHEVTLRVVDGESAYLPVGKEVTNSGGILELAKSVLRST